MKCPFCGYDLPNDAAFCASCGKNVSDASSATTGNIESDEGAMQPTQHTQPITTPNEAPGNAESGAPEAADAAAEFGEPADTCGEPAHFGSSIGNSSSSYRMNNAASHAEQFLATKKGKGIVAGVVAAVAAIIVAAVVGFNMANSVPEDTVRQALQNSSTVTDGVVANDYVTAQPYNLKSFKIDKQEDESTGEIGVAITGSDKTRHVYFSGSMENDFFKTDFTGEAYYVKQGDSWVSLLGPSITGNTTTPLQGVARISQTTGNDDYEISNFSSTLDSSNGTYTSTATQDVSYTFWFATDTATNTRTFVFDGNCWKPTGDTAVSNMHTATNFAGRKFEYTDTGSGLFKTGTTNSTIEFTSDGENGQVAATYSLDWKYSGDTSKGSSGQYYLPVNLSGNLTGTIEHEFGKDNFSIELNDAENQVTFTGGESYATISAGDGESNTMSLSATTNTKYFESPFQTSTYRMSMGTYVEKA